MEEWATWESANCCTCIMYVLFKSIIFVSDPMLFKPDNLLCVLNVARLRNMPQNA